MSAQHSEDERTTHDDEYALEDFSERNLKLRKRCDAVVAGKVEVELAPESEVERSREYAGRCVERCEGYRKLRVSS